MEGGKVLRCILKMFTVLHSSPHLILLENPWLLFSETFINSYSCHGDGFYLLTSDVRLICVEGASRRLNPSLLSALRLESRNMPHANSKHKSGSSSSPYLTRFFPCLICMVIYYLLSDNGSGTV